MVLDHLPSCFADLYPTRSAFCREVSLLLSQERIIGTAVFTLSQLSGDRRLAEACLLAYGCLIVSIGTADHDFFSNFAAYSVVASHFSILTLYALGVTEYHE